MLPEYAVECVLSLYSESEKGMLRGVAGGTGKEFGYVLHVDATWPEWFYPAKLAELWRRRDLFFSVLLGLVAINLPAL